jgi:hypothetical protein
MELGPDRGRGLVTSGMEVEGWRARRVCSEHWDICPPVPKPRTPKLPRLAKSLSHYWLGQLSLWLLSLAAKSIPTHHSLSHLCNLEGE